MVLGFSQARWVVKASMQRPLIAALIATSLGHLVPLLSAERTSKNNLLEPHLDFAYIGIGPLKLGIHW
jgi:hypothetical protein